MLKSNNDETKTTGLLPAFSFSSVARRSVCTDAVSCCVSRQTWHTHSLR